MYEKLLEVISTRAALVKNEGDYFKNELLHCGVCHEPKQSVIDVPFARKKIVVNLQCRCERENDEKQERMLREYNRSQRISDLIRKGVTSEAYKSCTFENDDQRNTEITDLCCRYVRHFSEMKRIENGILFYGESGKGKTFYAACIANALIQNEIPVLITSLSRLVQMRIKAMKDKTADISLRDFECFVLDDIGAENATQTAFSVIDDIYMSRKPMIVTTNLTPVQLKNSDSIEKKRMYDRILEVCGTKILVENNKNRLQSGIDKGRYAAAILGA